MTVITTCMSLRKACHLTVLWVFYGDILFVMTYRSWWHALLNVNKSTGYLNKLCFFDTLWKKIINIFGQKLYQFLRVNIERFALLYKVYNQIQLCFEQVFFIVRNYDHLTLSELGMTFLAAGFLAGRASWLRTSWLGGYSSVKHGRSFLEISISL